MLTMTMTAVLNTAPAAWLTQDPAPWDQVTGFGPSVFEAYARLRLIPDPVSPDQSATDHGTPEANPDLNKLRTLVEKLLPHTTTPSHGYFCFWYGFTGVVEDVDFRCPPIRESQLAEAPLVRLPHREYYLFEGPLEAIHQWQAGELLPAFVWPEDRAWCTAKDVDPHWVGIAAREQAVRTLLWSTDLDIVRADPTTPQPFYRH